MRETDSPEDQRWYSTYIPNQGGGSGGLSSWISPPRSSVPVDPSGEARVPFDRDGTYSLRTYVAGNRRSRRIEGTTPDEIQVQGSKTLLFEVQIPSDALAKALRAGGD